MPVPGGFAFDPECTEFVAECAGDDRGITASKFTVDNTGTDHARIVEVIPARAKSQIPAFSGERRRCKQRRGARKHECPQFHNILLGTPEAKPPARRPLQRRCDMGLTAWFEEGFRLSESSDFGSDIPQLGIKAQRQRFLQIGNAGRPAGSRLCADDALDGFHVTETPEVEAAFEIDKLLCEFIEIPTRFDIAINPPPSLSHARIGSVSAASTMAAFCGFESNTRGVCGCLLPKRNSSTRY